MFREAISSLVILAGSVGALASSLPVPQIVKVHRPGFDLSCFVYGKQTDATPLIVVNGGPGFDHRYMTGNDVWPRLAAHREVVFYDQRGTGQSKTTATPLSQDLASYLEDLDAIRKELKQPSVLVMGDSWGGFIAMAYAARYPEHVAKLILVDSVDSNWGNSLLLLDKVFPDRTPVNSSGEVTGDSLLASKASVTSYLSSLFYSQENFAEFMSAMPADMGPENAVFDAIGKTMGEIDLTRELKNITAPTLVINGRFDMNEPVITAFNLSKRIAGAHLAIFEKSGHLPFYEEADLFVKTVDAYMASRP